jgi:aminomethyltransferase
MGVTRRREETNREAHLIPERLRCLMPPMLKRTPLFATHQRLGARLVEFGGWEMPVHYTGIVEEHRTVRQASGLFDISHMGQFRVEGPAALQFLNHTLTNDVARIEVGQGQYTLLCADHGGVMDDLYLYRIAAEAYLLIVNASRVEADYAWLLDRLRTRVPGDSVQLVNLSHACAAVAVQGPGVARYIDACFPDDRVPSDPDKPVTCLPKNSIARVRFDDTTLYIARTGYTGEDGFEIFAPAETIEPVWNRLLEAGAPFGLRPSGLGARDTLRTEMGYPLYGHELDEDTSPLEAGLGRFVALDKGDFVGRAVLFQQHTVGLKRKCVAFRMTDKSPPPRPHYPIWSTGSETGRIGQVTSGTQSPSLGMGIGLGYVPAALAKPGTAIEIEIRGRRFAAETVRKPIYRPGPTAASA